jgi:hypothetical protein
MKRIEEWAKELNTPEWVLAAVKAFTRCGDGKEVTRAEYEHAVEAFLKAPIR